MATKATINYDDFLTKSSKLRQPSPIRALQPLLSIPGMISLGGGMPNPTTFPVTGMSFQLQDGQTLSLSPEETRAALQYSQTTGLPALNEWLTDLIVREHAPPQANQLKLCITTGSQEAAARAMEMLLEPEQDALLIESPTYSGALAAVYPMRVKLVKVPTDDNGLIPDALGKLLDNWDEEKERCRKPRVIYTIPTGSNPSGATLSLERRKQLYAICQHHNLLIMEDDPYRYLDFAPGRIPSLLSMDVDGRVLRFDSFSKIVSSGLRLGFVSGPAPLVDRIVLHGQAVSLHPSGISQALLLKLLEHWGPDGFEEHVAGVVDFYKAQRDAFLASAEKHLSGKATWNTDIQAGMFAWIKLNGVEDTKELITKRAVDEKVLFVPGDAFIPADVDHRTDTSGVLAKTPFIRAAYSTATPEEIETALSRLAKLLN